MQGNLDPKPAIHDPSEADVKSTGNYLEKVETGGLAPWSTHIDGDAANLSPGHREYLLKRHGTLELDPMPGFGDADPLNWTQWKVRLFFCFVTYLRLLTIFRKRSIFCSLRSMQ